MQKETYREINEELKRIGSRGYAGGMKMKLELETHRKRKKLAFLEKTKVTMISSGIE